MQNQHNEKRGRIKRNAPAQNLPLPLIGSIKIGEKRTKNKGNRTIEYPVSLDHFIATGDYAKMFHDAYGDSPSRVQVVFISDDNLQSCKEEYDARDPQGRRAGYGDGESCWLFNNDTEEYDQYDAVNDRDFIGQYTKQFQLRWQVVLTLHFILPAVRGVFGVWRLTTRGSKSSIGQIIQAFDNVKAGAGTVVNVPFDLKVEKVKSQKPNSTRIYPVLTLIPNVSSENIEILRGYIEQGGDVKQLGQLTPQKLEQLKSGEPHTEIKLLNNKND